MVVLDTNAIYDLYLKAMNNNLDIFILLPKQFNQSLKL